MIHSVKDFVDKKMNNKLICFNNVLDDYLFFYDKKKSKNRIIRINTGILSNMKQKIKEFYH